MAKSDQDQVTALESTGWLSAAKSELNARARVVRWILCGPVTLVLTVLILMGAAHWWPEGAARVDNIAVPVILFPLIWAGVFFYALAEDNIARGVLVMTVLTLGHVGLLAAVM
ncbi:MAG: hypothetical protein AAF754_17525 [Pseudomonadota bacterium]